jgi:DNA primase
MSSKAEEETTTIEVDGHQMVVTNPSKVFFSERGDTKLDLIEFYTAIREPLLAEMRGRPVLLQRFPHGAEGSSFFQKRVERGSTEWLTTTVVSTPNGTTSDSLVIVDLAHVIWAVNRACLGFHVWPYMADDPDHADELRIDLDPSPGVDFPMVREAARVVRRQLDEVPEDHRQPRHPRVRAGRAALGQLPGARVRRRRGA